MTIEEKRNAIKDYCDKRWESNEHCFECPLFEFDESCWEIGIDNSTIERNYNELFPTNNTDVVNHPDHYTNGSIECIDAMVAAYGKDRVAEYCVINAFKYIWRSEHKNGLEDIKKAIWYLNKHVELKESSYEEAV